MATGPVDFVWDPAFAMGAEAGAIARQVWPPYLREESDLPQPGLAFEIEGEEFRRRFPAWGLRSRHDGSLAGYLNAIFLYCALDDERLPEEGWQFAVEAGSRKRLPNCLCLVVANVAPQAQGRGVATLLLEKAKAEARSAGLRDVIAPVRPSHFSRRPELSFAEYVSLRRADGLPADPWLRAHARAGGVVRNICPRSATVTASLEKWSAWTGHSFDASGSYLLAGGLGPLRVDRDAGFGTYVEPNVWVHYRL